MPQISVNDLARLRQIRQWSQLYAAIHVPNDLLTARINDATIERGRMDITFDGGAAGAGYTQALFDALDEGTRLWVGSYAGGRDIGVIRVRSIARGAWPPTWGTVWVAENDGILWENDLYLTVKDEHRIEPKFPRVDVDEDTDPATITWWKDYDIVHDWQTHQEPPVVIMGPPACIFIDGATATENFWGNDSYSPRGTALSGTILWTFPHGTPATANTLGTEAAPHVVTWDTPGVYTVILSITDANGRTSVGYRLVFVFDRSGVNAPHQNFEIRNMRGNFSGGGWTTNIRFFGDRVYGEEYDVEDFPEGTQVVVFAEDWHNGELVSIGGYGHREEIVFVGWIKADTIRKEPITGEVSFRMHTVNGELRNCPGFPQTVERVTGVPDTWQEIQNMDMDLVGFYMGYWHSTLYEVVDVLESGDSSKVKYMDVIHTNLYNLLDKGVFNSTIFTRALSDRQSRFKYDRNPQYLIPAERNALATIMDLQDEDWLGRVDVQEVHENKVSWVDLSGVRVTATEEQAAVFSLAPGDVPAPDGAFKQFSRLVIDDQDDGNILSGYALAHSNNRLPRVRVPLQGNYRIFDLHPQEWITFNSLETLREGLGLEDQHEKGTPWPTGTRFIARDIDIGFRNDFGAFLVSMNMEAETTGPPGIAGYYPDEPPDDPDEPVEPEEPEEPIDPWRKKVYVATNVNGIYYTSTFSGPGGGNPIWGTVNDGLGTTNTRSIVGDPFNPKGRQYTRTTEPKIYRRTGGDWGVILDVATALPLISAHSGIPVGSLQSGEWNGPTCNINAQGHVYALVHVVRTTDWRGRLYFFKSINYGADWTVHLIADWNVGLGGPKCLRVGAFQGSSPHAAGQVIYAVAKALVTGGWALWVSTNQGVNWGARILLWHCGPSGEDGDLARSPADQDTIYWVGWGTPPLEYTLRKSTTRGNSWSIIWACAAPPPSIMQRPGIYIWEPLSAFMATGGALHWTENDWTNYTTQGNTNNFPVDGCSRVMDYPENLYAWQINDPVGAEMEHVIAVSSNRGAQWEGKAGDDPVTPSVTSIPNNCGGVAGILQIWVG